MLIGLSGTKGSGKSTCARYLVSKHGFHEYSFAEAVKLICKTLGAPFRSLYGSQLEKEQIIPWLGVSGRELMQVVGTELFREQLPRFLPNFKPGKDIWVKIIEEKIRRLSKNNIVISDVRFDNEAAMIQKNKGIVIVISRENSVKSDAHASEKGICNYDMVVSNDGDILDTYSILDSIVQRHK
jgi:hypothetical protein